MRCLCCLTFFAFGLLLLRAEAQDECIGLPINSDVESSFRTLLVNQGGEGGVALTIRSGPFYTCQAQGSTMGIYRELSVVMTYARDATPNNVITWQFELDCTDSAANTWSDRSNSLSTPGNGFDYMNSLRTDCARCVNTVPNENHCQPCDSACNSGLMRCTGTSSSDCCVAFENNGMCRADLNCTETNFVANVQNNFTCECGLTCDLGFTVNSTDCLSCVLSDICLADMDTCNGGQCVLNSAPDNFTCNCTGTGFTGPNCTVPPPAPSSSLTTSVTSSSSSSVSSSSPPSSSSSVVSTTSSSSIPSSPTASVNLNTQEKKVFIPAIVISVIVGLLMLIVLIVLIIYTIYYFLSGKGFDMAKIKNNTPFANGESHNNPLYLKPDEVTSEVANLYTPTDP